MQKIKLNDLIDLQIDHAFIGNIEIPATQHEQTLTLIDKYNNEIIITIENNKIEIYKN